MDWIWATIKNVLVFLQFLFPGGVGWGGPASQAAASKPAASSQQAASSQLAARDFETQKFKNCICQCLSFPYSVNFQVSRFTPRSRSGFQDAISKFQDSHQDPGQGFKVQFPSFKIHTKIQVRVSRCSFQVSRFKPRSRSGFQDAISKFQDSHQDPGQGFKVQFPSFKIHTKIQVRVSRCNFQVSRFTPRSRSGFQDAISKFQDSHQDPGQGFKVQFPSFKIHTKIQVGVSRCNFQVSRFTPRSRSGFQDAISKFQDSHQEVKRRF